MYRDVHFFIKKTTVSFKLDFKIIILVQSWLAAIANNIYSLSFFKVYNLRHTIPDLTRMTRRSYDSGNERCGRLFSFEWHTERLCYDVIWLHRVPSMREVLTSQDCPGPRVPLRYIEIIFIYSVYEQSAVFCSDI